MPQIKPIYKNTLIVIVLFVAFICSTLLAIDISVNLSVPVQNSNRRLDSWVQTLEGNGYDLYYSDFKGTSNMIQAETLNDFKSMLGNHEMSEAYYEWTQLGFPFSIEFGKIWFVDEGTTYYLETTW
jgi:Na+-transporting NADH:ubiquinone oxidoreductase subunit NqrC